MKIVKMTLLIVAIFLGSAVSGNAQGTGSTPPDFTATDISGTKLTLSDLKGKVVLLDFWATWCPPCRVEVPNLLDIFRKYKDKKFVLISVSLDRDLDAASKFVKEKGMDWVHIINREVARALAEKYQVEYIPSTFLIDRKGKIAASQLRGSDLKEKIGELLK